MRYEKKQERRESAGKKKKVGEQKERQKACKETQDQGKGLRAWGTKYLAEICNLLEACEGRFTFYVSLATS